MKKFALLVLLVSLWPLSASGDVRINLGVAVPRLDVVVGVPGVQYAPETGANVFVYGGQYYVFEDGAWYAGPGYRGPWTAVQVVPEPVLQVPVRYYRRAPEHWRAWNREGRPHWEEHHHFMEKHGGRG